ncbi:hypothetical protein SRHO_G00247480 [Serrasalmus rhombeus]
MRRKSPTNDAVFHVAAGRDRAGLEVKHISSFKGEQSRSISWTGPPRGRSVSARSVVLNLGRGVFAATGLARGEFVLEYRGDLISGEESRRRRRVYHGAMNAFMFDFLWHGKFWTIDAARDDGSLGRLVNDDHINPNCKMKRLIVEGRPHLCLFALRDITPGEEITYNYGDGDCPWRSEVIKSGMEVDNNHLESEGASGDDQHCTKPSQHKSAFGIQMKKNAGSNRLESEVASGDDQHHTQHSQLESTFCSKAMMDKDIERAEKARNFSDMYAARWGELISSHALRTQREVKWNAPLVLPFTEDVKMLHLYLDQKQEEFFQKLSADASSKNWTLLAKVTLAQTILFNRRREGHDVRVHRDYYRLPEGTLQLAKISKILMALETGRLGEFSGKNLDEIHIDPNEAVLVQSSELSKDLSETEDESDEDPGAKPNLEPSTQQAQESLAEQAIEPTSTTSVPKGVRMVKRKKWETSEVKAVEKHLNRFIKTCTVPGKKDCEACIKAEPVAFKDRDWLSVKFFVKNRITALKRKM